MKYKARIIFLALAAFYVSGVAGAEPFGITAGNDNVPQIAMVGIDLEATVAEDVQRIAAGQPYRYSIPLSVDVRPDTSGIWVTDDNGDLVWRVRILAEKAKMINLGFTEYAMPEGAELSVYSMDGREIRGPFTDKDNEAHGQLWTPIIFGNELVVELKVAPEGREKVRLHLTTVGHGYQGFGFPVLAAEKSGACNVDVICPEGDGWRDQIRSVAVIGTGGGTFCTGFLVNNVANDLTPYFMTANHCGITAGAAPSLVTYWNFENSTCRVPGSGASGGAGDGSLAQFNTGSIFRSAGAASDFTLVELDDPIDPAVNPFFAGLDATTNDAPSATAIHHPSTDEKRISFEFDPTTTTTYLQEPVPGDGTHIRITNWDVGTTEPGSSGSPLFDQNQRIVGQLHGGFASCTSATSDWYGRISFSWNGGGTDATSLRPWLDPANTGNLQIDGRNLSPFTVSSDPAVLGVCTPDLASTTVSVTDAGGGFTDPVTLALTGAPAGAMVIFGTNPVIPGNTSTLDLTTGAVAAGEYAMSIDGSSGMESSNSSLALSVSTQLPGAATLTQPADMSTGQLSRPELMWTPGVEGQQFTLEIATDAGFTNIVYNTTVTNETSHIVAVDLAPLTQYFWRVQTSNNCGSAPASSVFSFTTEPGPTVVCNSTVVSIPDNNPAGITSDIVIATPAPLTDLDVSIDITHTFDGDLELALQHTDTGTSIVLFQDQCGTNEDVDVILDDAAADAVGDNCSAAAPGIQGTLRPLGSLAQFNSESINGTWTLAVVDDAAADTGTLNEWCLRYQAAAPPENVFVDGFESPPPPGR